MQTAADELKRKRMANLRPRPRVKGQANRITRDLRQSIIDAASAFGSDGRGSGGLVGYCYFLAARHPKAFCSLLGKLLPFQIDGHLASTVTKINVVSVPVDRYLGDGAIEPTEPGHFLTKDGTRTDS